MIFDSCPNMLNAIIFDFDGVICESVEAKTEAFRKLFRDHPQHLEKIIQFHMANGGMSRYEKFKIIYRDFLKKELTEKESLQLGQRFTEYAYDSVVKSVFVKGAYEFLDRYHKKFSLFIVSGTPQDEMISIVKKRKLDKFFKAIYGSPATKTVLIKIILDKNKMHPDQVIFVGDSMNDYSGARQAGVEFIARIHPQYSEVFKGAKIDKKIHDLAQLDHWIAKISSKP